MDNLASQVEEIETLIAIYGEEFQVEDEKNRVYSIQIVNDSNHNIFVKLFIKLPEDYPSTAPPTFELSAPHLKKDEKEYLHCILGNVYLSNLGQNIIYQSIEKIREELQTLTPQSNEKLKESNFIPEESIISTDTEETLIDCPSIIHGEVVTDRKSSFQGHAATVFSVQEVKQVINKLKENRKIQQATHNISAYRIYNENNKTFIHDCDDDGESQAGGRLLHLLEILNVKNVVVVVSRWYGGIHLGPDRFRHINNAARQVLVMANLIDANKKT